MKKTSLNAIRIALKAGLAELQKTGKLPDEGHWEYHRGANGDWQGAFVPRPSFMGLVLVHELSKLAAGIRRALEQDYPEYLKAVGTPLGGGGLQPVMVLQQLAREAYTRFGTFGVSDDQIEELLIDVPGLFDRKTMRLRLYAPVLNLCGPRETPSITFADEITLRPITDEECTSFYGGNPIFQELQRRPISFPEFVFVKEIEVPKIVGSFDDMKEDPIRPVQEELDRCILALATFKDAGAVGYDGIRIAPTDFMLGHAFAGRHIYGNEHVPFSRYDITPEEAPQIEAHARLFGGMHSTLEMASQRLVDSARRTRARDTIVDAVIGLESILLASLKDRAELRFRFSLNYASLFPKEERRAAFHTARDLYDLRSKIAHGGSPGEKVKIEGKELTLGDAATLARSVLRKTIAIFMPSAKKPDFMAEDYWLSKELGF